MTIEVRKRGIVNPTEKLLPADREQQILEPWIK